MVSTGVHGDITSAQQRQHAASIASGVFHTYVPAHAGHGQHLAVFDSKSNRKRVVDTWVTIENDVRFSHPPCLEQNSRPVENTDPLR
jgi:hypothetical protein